MIDLQANLDRALAAARRSPTDPLAIRNLGRALVALGRVDEAMEQITRLETLSPEGPEALLLRAELHLALLETEEALDAIDAATELAPDHPGVARVTGQLNIERNPDLALRDLMRAARADPADLEALVLVARALARLSRRDDAEYLRDVVSRLTGGPAEPARLPSGYVGGGAGLVGLYVIARVTRELNPLVRVSLLALAGLGVAWWTFGGRPSESVPDVSREIRALGDAALAHRRRS